MTMTVGTNQVDSGAVERVAGMPFESGPAAAELVNVVLGLPLLEPAYRTGAGTAYAEFGIHDLQAAFSQPVFANHLVQTWLPAIPWRCSLRCGCCARTRVPSWRSTGGSRSSSRRPPIRSTAAVRLQHAACLPVGLAQQPSAATGTVIRPATVRGYAAQAGFTSVEQLPVEHPQRRRYRLGG